MTIQDNQGQQTTPATQQPSDKELNFRKLEAKYQQQLDHTNRQLEQEKQARQELEKRSQKPVVDEEDDHSDEPYVDHKKLNKKLAKYGEQAQKQTQNEIQKAVQEAIYKERQNAWLNNHPDFQHVLENHADKLEATDRELADAILEMPNTFERQKLVYKNIKALGLDKPIQKQASIQDKIDANRRSPFYQPTSVGSSPYTPQADHSPEGQKQAYDKIQQLKSNLRI